MNREIVRQRRHLMLIMVKFPYHDASGIKNHMYDRLYQISQEKREKLVQLRYLLNFFK